MAIQNEQSQIITTASTVTMAALAAPLFQIQPGTLCFTLATNQLWVYQPNLAPVVVADAFHIASSQGGFWQLEPIMGNPYATIRGFVEMPYGDPSLHGAGSILTTQTINTHRFIAQNGGTVANVVMVTTTSGSTLTAATTLTASGAAAGTGAQLGQVLLTTGSTASFATGDICVVTGLVGTTEGNGTWQITVVDGTHVALTGSVFVNVWVSGGTVARSNNTVALYSAAGVWLGAAADQVTAWQAAAGTVTMALANTASPLSLVLTQGAVYYMALVTAGTTPPIFMGLGATIARANLGLTAGTIQWGTNPASGATKLSSALAPASTVITSALPNWVALS
jgi:hypothetical protein